MKNLFTAIILGIALAGVAAAQGTVNRTAKVKIAVVEFTPGTNAAGMTAEAKRQLQASTAFALTETKKFEVVDVRNTRSATQSSLAAINGDASTAAAVKAGKQLGVAYVVTGTVTEYSPKRSDGHGSAAVMIRMVEVATGKVKYSGEVLVRSGKKFRTGSAVEMQAEVMKHLVDQFTEILEGKV